MSKRQEQWMEVGMAFERPLIERTPLVRGIASGGLCHGILQVSGISHYRVLGLVGDFDSSRFSPELSGWTSRKGELERASFAYLMAAMTDAERDAIVVGL